MISAEEIEVLAIHRLPLRDRPDVLAFVNARIGVFKVKGMRIIQNGTGRISLEFPEKPLLRKCPTCRYRTNYHCHFCGECGNAMPPAKQQYKPNGHKLYGQSMFHPVDVTTRSIIEQAILGVWLHGDTPQANRSMTVSIRGKLRSLRMRSLDEFDDVERANAAFPA